MTNTMPPIPDALRRSSPQKAPRQRTELPDQLSDGTVIADLSIQQLIDLRDERQELIAGVPSIELELRSIRAQIRKKA